MGTGDTSNAVQKCGLLENVVFVIAIVTGTACSICSKTMMQLEGVGIDGDIEVFEKPIFQVPYCVNSQMIIFPLCHPLSLAYLCLPACRESF